MKARDAIEQLKGLDPNEEIILAWWNEDWINEVLTNWEEPKLERAEWNEIVRNYENSDVLFQDVADFLKDESLSLINEREEN
jgi:hypothetical protein